MEKNNQPIIITSIIIGGFLIIALALIFTRNDDTTTETTNENNTSENGEAGNGEDVRQPETPEGPQNPETPEQPETPEGPQNPETPEQPENPENPPESVLPDNWDSLTLAEKTALNPFGCDLEIQFVRADNGRCQEKPGSLPEQWPVKHIVLSRVTRCPDEDPVFPYSCQRRPSAAVAVQGNPTDEDLDELWSAYLENFYSCREGGLSLYVYDYNGSDDRRDYGQLRKIYECRQGIEYVELHKGALCLYLRQLGPNCSKGGEAVPYITQIVAAVKDDPSDQELEKFFDDFVESYPACGSEPEGFELLILDYDDSDETEDYAYGMSYRRKRHFGCRGDVEYVFLRSGGLCVEYSDGGGACSTELYVGVKDNPSDEELERFASFYLEEYKWQPGFSLAVYDHNGSNDPEDYPLNRSDAAQSPRKIFHGGTDF